MEYELIKNLREREDLHSSFFALAEQTFGLSFAPWYRGGYWTDKYIPYAITDGSRVVSNVSVNRIHVKSDGENRHYIQLGTVMTDPEYRERGLSARLMEAVLADWQDRCDGIYLYANDTVLDFYPRFGFVPAKEYQCGRPLTPKPSRIRRLDMDAIQDRVLLKQYYEKSNPFSELTVMENYGLLMFYCGFILKDCVYYIQDEDAVVIADYNDGRMVCFDIFCGGSRSMDDILVRAAREDTNSVLFGFSPKDKTGCLIEEIGGDETPFFLKGKDNPFSKGRRRFPLLSHA